MANQQRPQLIKLKIDVTKIDKKHFFHGKARQDGTHAIYVDALLIPNKDGADQYGNTHFIAQSVSKETRDADPKARGPIIGNATVPDAAPAPARAAAKPKAAAPPATGGETDDDDGVPF